MPLVVAEQPPVDSLRGAVTGVVFDSLARAPLAGAEVQLMRAGDGMGVRLLSATTDRDGRYRIDSVAAGAYVVGFVHPRLDSLGVSVQPTRVDVAANRTTRVTLALPSATTVQRQLCAPDAISDTTALVFGFVRDAATLRPRDSAVVEVAWTEFTIGRGGVARETRGGAVAARSGGWFTACGVPAGTAVTLRAIAGADTSGRVPVDVAGRSVALRTLLVGAGTARLVGAVRTVTGQPVVGARVSLVDGGDTVVTPATGAFTLAAVPAGSRAIDVRAVGFLPKRQIVDVRAERAERADGAPTVAEVTLTSFSAYLDTVKVTRRRLYYTDPNGFERRRRASASGYFIDRERVERVAPIYTTDLLRQIPGVSVLPATTGGGDQIFMRGTWGGRPCQPEMYIDGMLWPLGFGVDGWTINFLAPPERIEGIEVYPRSTIAPVEYTRTMSGCGSVVIWTRAPDPRPPRRKKEKPPKPAHADTLAHR